MDWLSIFAKIQSLGIKNRKYGQHIFHIGFCACGCFQKNDGTILFVRKDLNDLKHENNEIFISLFQGLQPLYNECPFNPLDGGEVTEFDYFNIVFRAIKQLATNLLESEMANRRHQNEIRQNNQKIEALQKSLDQCAKPQQELVGTINLLTRELDCLKQNYQKAADAVITRLRDYSSD